MENQEYSNFDLFKTEETKEHYEICDHEYTIKSDGMKICVTCGLCLRRLITFSTDDYYEDENRFFLKKQVQIRLKKLETK